MIPLFHGFLLGFSLIFAIGAQNIFVFRQGLLGKYVLPVVLFCALSDAFLIFMGVLGLSFFLIEDISWLKPYLFLFAALWLFFYGCLRIKSALFTQTSLIFEKNDRSDFWPTIAILALLTFANPHVYLDTVLLLGTVSLKYFGFDQILFGLGASLASFIFFFGLGYGSKILMPLMQKPKAWNIFDFAVGLLMFFLALLLFNSSGFM
jgi:L-lysine exporter family protein LysE/ArgO